MKTKSVAGFYSEEAARIVSEAARAQQPAPKSAIPAAPVPPANAIPPIRLDDPQRPLLRPQPAINQNAVAPRPLDEEFEPEPQVDVGRVIAWIVLAPWYLAVIAGSIGIEALFVKDLLGL